MCRCKCPMALAAPLEVPSPASSIFGSSCRVDQEREGDHEKGAELDRRVDWKLLNSRYVRPVDIKHTIDDH